MRTNRNVAKQKGWNWLSWLLNRVKPFFTRAASILPGCGAFRPVLSLWMNESWHLKRNRFMQTWPHIIDSYHQRGMLKVLFCSHQTLKATKYYGGTKEIIVKEFLASALSMLPKLLRSQDYKCRRIYEGLVSFNQGTTAIEPSPGSWDIQLQTERFCFHLQYRCIFPRAILIPDSQKTKSLLPECQILFRQICHQQSGWQSGYWILKMSSKGRIDISRSAGNRQKFPKIRRGVERCKVINDGVLYRWHYEPDSHAPYPNRAHLYLKSIPKAIEYYGEYESQNIWNRTYWAGNSWRKMRSLSYFNENYWRKERTWQSIPLSIHIKVTTLYKGKELALSFKRK